MSLRAGERVLDRYVLEGPIANGAMGSVWTAVDDRGHQVAVKVVTDDLDDPTRRARLSREAALLARLHHPNVVSLLGFGELDGGVPILVMELVAGRRLDVVLLERGAIRYHQAVDWMEQILGGLEALHAKQVVHRDIKPGNVLVTIEDDYLLKIIDLGIARSARAGTARLTRRGRTVGSLDYMAPEQLADAAVDARADIYAAGMVLYQMVAGRLPFPGVASLEAAMRRMKDPPPPPVAPAHLLPLPAALVDVIMSMLDRRPDRRPATAALAAARLAAALRRG